MSYNIRRSMDCLIIMSILSVLFLFNSQSISARENYCVVIAIENNAWVTKKESGVKKSLSIGDRLNPGDRVDVYHGSSVDLAFDREALNVLHVKGETNLEIKSLSETNVALEDTTESPIDEKRGNVVGLLDNRRMRQSFEVVTPTSITSANRTQFQVSNQVAGTEVSAYKGNVRVTGRDARGNKTSENMLVESGYKTSVVAEGRNVLIADPEALSPADIAQINEIRMLAKELRDWLKDKGISDDDEVTPTGEGEAGAPAGGQRGSAKSRDGLIPI